MTEPAGVRHLGGVGGSAAYSFERTVLLQAYDGMDLAFLARGPRTGVPSSQRVGPLHEGTWLIVWREGGRLSQGINVPDALGGVERWLAVPLSESRAESVVHGTVSLREVIAYSEWEPVILEGPNPLHPEIVVAASPYRIPQGYLPTGDVSLLGNRMLELPPVSNELVMPVLIHLVPDGIANRPDVSLADAGSIQEAITRYLGWTIKPQGAGPAPLGATGLRTKSHREPESAIRFVPPGEWTQLGLVSASPGTMLIQAELKARAGADLKSYARGFAQLIEKLGRDSLAASGEGQNDEVLRLALLGLADLISSRRISVTIKWAADGKECSAMLSVTVAERIVQIVTDALRESGLAHLAVARIEMSTDDVQRLGKEDNPEGGGFQKLVYDLARQIREVDGRFYLDLHPEQVERVIRYVQDYGEGGHQERLRPIYSALYRLGISFVGIR